MSRLRLPPAVLVLVLLLPSATLGLDHEEDQTSKARSPYLLRSAVVSAGGCPEDSPRYPSNGTLGQPHPVGLRIGPNAMVYSGFWGHYL